MLVSLPPGWSLREDELLVQSWQYVCDQRGDSALLSDVCGYHLSDKDRLKYPTLARFDEPWLQARVSLLKLFNSRVASILRFDAILPCHGLNCICALELSPCPEMLCLQKALWHRISWVL